MEITVVALRDAWAGVVMSVPLRCTDIQVALPLVSSASGCVPGYEAQQKVEGVSGGCAGGGGGGEGCGEGEGGGGRAECGREDEQDARQVAGVAESAGDEEGEKRGGEAGSGLGSDAVSVVGGHGRAFCLELGFWVGAESSEPEPQVRRKLHFSGL